MSQAANVFGEFPEAATALAEAVELARLARRQNRPKRATKKPVVANVSSVGDEIKALCESSAGIKITCGTCLAYLQALNQTTSHDHAAIVKTLAAEISWPDRMKTPERIAMVSRLINPVVPKPAPVTPPLSYPLKFVTTIQPAVRIAKRITPRWQETLASLSQAGFVSTKTYCEPDSGVAGDIVWPTKKGPIGSFKAMCFDLLATTDAEWFLLCEDDIAVSSHTADYLRQFNLTNEVLSLYTSGTRRQNIDKWAKIRQPLIGSLALLMRRSTLQAITQTSQWANWPKADCVDQLIHRACAEQNIPVLTHNPSLVQHTGDTAAIYADRKLTRNRVAKDWSQDWWNPLRVTVITPTGDRPEAFALCERWISQQTYTGQIQWIVVDDGIEPTTCTMGQHYIRQRPMPHHSLCRNLRAAIPHIEGECIFVVEDDDYYSPHYLSTMVGRLQRADLVGELGAKYYYLRHRSFRHNHQSEHHASLCRTGMTRAVLGTLERCAQGWHPSVDLRLWRAWKGSTFTWRDADGTQSLCVGMKGVEGRQSRGWKPSRNAVRDTDLKTLEKWVGKEAAEIYRNMMTGGSG
jgi:hypothetical protein